jgi:hypothetical protein
VLLDRRHIDENGFFHYQEFHTVSLSKSIPGSPQSCPQSRARRP